MRKRWFFTAAAAALLAGGILAAGYLVVYGLRPTSHGTGPEISRPSTRPKVPVPAVRFTDITDPAGIRFRHTNGATGKKLLPETMGSGVAFLDYNNDGRPDILFVNS